MKQSPEPARDANPPWARRYSRLFAAALALSAGYGFAQLFIKIDYTINYYGPKETYLLYLATLATALFSFMLFSSRIVSEISPRKSILYGTFSPILGICAASEILYGLPSLGSGQHFRLEDAIGIVITPLFFAYFGSFLTLFLPEAIGGVCGLLLWWLAQGRGKA